ncbi:MAG: hypothetical protein HN718_14880 [Rhodospirillales bacterium]|jgi:hypothetical protein|nr:hypothetical protein [Rhodospirillales bacterium]MBT5352356.1 hypothetical protein [Rhodospirillales bacterium]MBT5519802.1 hypothetical protein [Rhodospirillales bacterium]MBT6111665.1 hypothetical protein [Rhodospirillales bacterium]MBT7779798.1 hypothetical protein [Rhodospirillales bacterium]
MQIRTLLSIRSLPMAIISCFLLVGCIGTTSRLGMVKEADTGLMFGSVIERNLVTDASFFSNRGIKVRIRNTSGDIALDLYQFKSRLEQAYRGIGYEPTDGDDFGLIVDVNLRYSGQIQTNLGSEFSFLGAAAGGLAGYSVNDGFGAAVGTVAGATLGSIVGSFITDDTFIVVADVTFGVIKESKSTSSKTISFSHSTNADSDNEEEEDVGTRSFRSTHETSIAVFAGGRNVTQSEIAEQVRSRIIRIVSNII